MWLLPTAAAAFASRKNRSTIEASVLRLRLSTLSATTESVCTCRARYTAPKPPAPSRASMR